MCALFYHGMMIQYKKYLCNVTRDELFDLEESKCGVLLLLSCLLP